jgi:hypothetical protein
MAKKLSLLLGLFMVLFIFNMLLVSVIYANTEKETKIAIILGELDKIEEFDTSSSEYAEYFQDSTIKDKRVAVLKAFLRHYDSALYDHAEFIVKVSDEYLLDYRLIPAIAMQESTGCKFIPQNSYNCWGWGIYGNTVTRFSSYPEAIQTIAKGLKTNYVDKGLTTPEQIMRKYTPSSNGSWSFGVNYFLEGVE